MSKISFKEIRDHEHLLEHLVLRCASEKRGVGRTLMQKLRDGEFDPQNMDIKFSIDGIEFPVVEIFQEFAKQHDRMIKERAAELLSEKFGEFDDMICEMQKSIESIARKKLGIEFEREW